MSKNVGFDTGSSSDHVDGWLTVHAFSGIFRMATQLVAMMILVPIIIHYEGEERYGVWTLAMAIGGLLAFLELGLVQATNRFLAEVDYKTQQQEIRDLACTTFWLTVASGFLVILVGLPFSEEIAGLFDVPDKIRNEAGLVIAVMIWRLALSIPLRNFNAVLISQRFMARAHIAQGFMNLVYFGGGYLAIVNGLGLECLASVYLFTMLAEHFVYILMSIKVLPLTSYSPFRFKPGLVGKILEFSTFAWLGQMVNLIYMRAGVLFVQLTAGLVATGAYGIAMRLTAVSSELATQVIFAGGPQIAKLAASSKRGKKEAGLLALALARRSMLLAGPLAAVAIPLGGPFLHGWVGVEMAATATIPLALLSSSIAFSAPSMTASNTLTLMGEHRWTNVVAMILVLIYLPTTYFGGYFLGADGVALSSFVINVFIASPVFLARLASSSSFDRILWWRAVYRPHVWPFIFCLIFGIGIAQLIYNFVPAGRIWMLWGGLGGFLAVCLYFLIYFRFTAPLEERERMTGLAKRVLSKIKR